MQCFKTSSERTNRTGFVRPDWNGNSNAGVFTTPAFLKSCGVELLLRSFGGMFCRDAEMLVEIVDLA